MAAQNTAIAKKQTEVLELDEPSAAMRQRWAKRIAAGTAKPIPVFVGGVWSVNVQRGNKRILRLQVG